MVLQPNRKTVPVRLTRWFGPGYCLGRHEVTGQSYVVEGGIPGELVEVAAGDGPDAHRGVRPAQAVLEASDDRVVPFCPHAARCTGCRLLHLSRNAEIAFKRLQISEILARYAAIYAPPESLDTIAGAARSGFRARAAYRVERSADGVMRMGLGARDGGIVHIPDCPVTTPEVREAAQLACETLRARDSSSRIERVELAGDSGRFSVVLGHADGRREPLSTPAVARGRSVLAGVVLPEETGAWRQTAPSVAAMLYEWVSGWVFDDTRSVLDATCGIGGLTVYLAPRVERFVGVDINYDAVLAARRTAALNGVKNGVFRGGKIQVVAPRMYADGQRFDLTIVNPMRQSLGEETMRALAAITERRLIYLAPAARAGAEDFRTLVQEGWSVRRVGLCDLHPGTASVMAVAVFDRGETRARSGR